MLLHDESAITSAANAALGCVHTDSHVLELFPHSSRTVLKLCGNCAGTVREQFQHCAACAAAAPHRFERRELENFDRFQRFFVQISLILALILHPTSLFDQQHCELEAGLKNERFSAPCIRKDGLSCDCSFCLLVFCSKLLHLFQEAAAQSP